VLESIELFKSGRSIGEITTVRKLAESTIENHLAVGIRNNLVDIHHVLKMEEIDEMKKLFDFSKGELAIKEAYVKSNLKFSYGKLKMVQSWLVSSV
jgi:hypothetical protein